MLCYGFILFSRGDVIIYVFVLGVVNFSCCIWLRLNLVRVRGGEGKVFERIEVGDFVVSYLEKYFLRSYIFKESVIYK